MIAISHNCDEVLSWLRGVGDKASTVPERVLEPGQYMPALVSTAERVLDSFTTSEEKALIPGLIATIQHWATQTSTAFEMHAVEDLGQYQPGDIGYNDLQPLEKEIADWVAQYKEKDERDLYTGGRTHTAGEAIPDDFIARRIMAIFGRDPQKWLGSTNDKGLVPYLRQVAPDKFGQVFGLTPLGQTRISELLGKVLDAWFELMGVQVMDIALADIDSALR